MITCVIFVLGAIVYGLFATAEIQPWAVAKTDEYPETSYEEELQTQKPD